MIIKKNITKEKWFTYEDSKVRVCLRLFNFSKMSVKDMKKALKEKYMFCLTNWEGLINEDGTKFECNTENKEFVYEYYNDIRNFIFKGINELDQELAGEIKN